MQSIESYRLWKEKQYPTKIESEPLDDLSDKFGSNNNYEEFNKILEFFDDKTSGFELIYYNDDSSNVYIGLEPEQMGENETAGQFKQRITNLLNQLFPDSEEFPSWHTGYSEG